MSELSLEIQALETAVQYKKKAFGSAKFNGI